MNITLLDNSQFSRSIIINKQDLNIVAINNFSKTITINTNVVTDGYLLKDSRLYISDSIKPVVRITNEQSF